MRRFTIVYVVLCLGFALEAFLYLAFGLGWPVEWHVLPAGIGMAGAGLAIFWISNKIADFVERNYP